MNTITLGELEALCQDGQAIDNKGGYPAVVLHTDGTISKLWARKKKLISSATLRPYSNRFIKNAKELSRRGVITPEIISHTVVQKSHIRIVRYQTLLGQSIRELLEKDPQEVDIKNLCQYIYQLHQKGILFKGMHLGNIIQQPNQKGFGLIDFTDVKFYSKPIPMLRRAANLATPLRYKEDIDHLAMAGLPDLLKSYLKLLPLSKTEEQNFRREVARHIK
jgi:hypothetical protein